MPIRIDRDRAKQLARQFDESLELVHNEFEGLSPERHYRNAFARLLKPDPLARVLMMGTDQRDRLIPRLRSVIERCVPAHGHIFDFGAGDGQTFALAAPSVPAGTRISIQDPIAGYVADYTAFLESQSHLQRGLALVAGFEVIDRAAQDTGTALPADESVDLALALHMIYFLPDLPAALRRMVRFVKPDGALFVVFADESESYTGRVLRRFLDLGGQIDSEEQQLAAIDERRRLLASRAGGGGGIREVLRADGAAVRLESQLQRTRLYGHSLADVIALATITALSSVGGPMKFDVAADLLREAPESVDLRIENTGPRRGMWSVAQPQWVCVVRKLRES